MELLKRFSKTERLDFDKNETIMNYIHNNALKMPNQVAVSDTITDITYGEFNRYINALSAILHNLGVEKGECVGVLLPRIPMYIVSCMGITRNASVFVPLDLTYPKDRIDYIIEESNETVSLKTDINYVEKDDRVNSETMLGKFMTLTPKYHTLPRQKDDLHEKLRNIERKFL